MNEIDINLKGATRNLTSKMAQIKGISKQIEELRQKEEKEEATFNLAIASIKEKQNLKLQEIRNLEEKLQKYEQFRNDVLSKSKHLLLLNR